MRSAPPSLRSYSFIIFGFCLIFLIFGYRSLRRSSNSDSEEFGDEIDEGEGASGNLAKLLQARCNAKKLERLGEYGICAAKGLNREKSCLLFSVASNPDLKFEMHISEQMDKCKLRVYGHESVANDMDVKFKVLEKLDGERLTDKMLSKILGTEKKGKIHLLRLDAGVDTVKLAQTKLLKERQICHLLLTVSIGDAAGELGGFVRKMKQNHGFNLYAISPLKGGMGAGADEMGPSEGENEEEEEEEGEGKKRGGGKKKEEEAEEEEGGNGGAGRKYALSFIQQSCQKAYEVKAN